LKYRDDMEVELGDTVEVDESPKEFEPEEAVVTKIGKKKIQVEYTNTLIKNRKVWADPKDCDLIARED